MTTTCGGTTDNWQPDQSYPGTPAPWFTSAGGTRNNWVLETTGAHTNASIPNVSTDNVCVSSDYAPPTYDVAGTTAATPLTVGCLMITSGTLNLTATGARTLNISGKFFRNLNVGSLTTNANVTIAMTGTSAQTFESVDNVNNLTISNAVSVELTQSFSVTSAFTISAGAGVVYVDGTFTLPSAGGAVAIPTGATVEVKSGGQLIAPMGLSVTGTLKIDAGASVLVGNGSTITINSGGLLNLSGTSGNPAVLDANGAGTNSYNVTVANGGAVNFNYFTINRLAAAGLNFAVGSKVNLLNNGSFHYLAASGYAVTLPPAGTFGSLATTWSSIGFYNDAGNATVRNFNVGTYTGSAITLTNWDGAVGGATNSNPASSAKLSWGAQASPQLQVTNHTSSGSPPSSIAASSGTSNLFLTAGFDFSNSTGSPTTDVTSIKLTLEGTNSAADISALNAYVDTNGNCSYDAGTDTVIPAAQISAFSGSPPTATVTLNSGQLTVNSTSPKCIMFYMTVASTAQNGDTVGLKIAGTSDVVNSNTYSFDPTATPPVTGTQATITSATSVDKWMGGTTCGQGTNCNWNTSTANWSTGAYPTATTDCQFGAGYSVLSENLDSQSCRNLTLPDGGAWDWPTASFTFNIGGSLTNAPTTYTYSGNQATATLNFNGTTNQGITGGVAWPGAVTINSSAAANQITLSSNWTISGNLTITTGNFVIAAGTTLTVGGNVSVGASGTLTIQPGATLKFSTNGSTLTVAAGGTLALLGNSSNNATITSSSTATNFTVAVSGTISANYYALSNTGNPGLLINAGATIDASNYLQNGSFSCGASGSTFLKLNRRIPPGTSTTSDVLTGMTFSQGACAGTPISIDTSATTSPPAGTKLTLNSYSGNRSGTGTDNSAANYAVSWGTPTNTLQLTSGANATFTTVSQGASSQIMGRFQLQQTPTGFADTALTSVKLTLTGTGSASDVTAVKLFYDPSCNSTGTTQLGNTMTFTGSPPTATFSGTNFTSAIIPYSTAPLTRCLYVTYDISSSATAGDTLGVEIAANSDVANSQSYGFQGGYAPPVILYDSAGSPNYASVAAVATITWTGATSSAFNTNTNWTPNTVPSATINCTIPSAATAPQVTATSTCNSVNITNGNLTITATGTLKVNGSFTNTGTFTNSGALQITDSANAVASTQTITSTSAISGLTFAKTHGGTVNIGNSSLTITGSAAPGLSIPASQNFTFQLNSGDTLTIPMGMTISSGVFQMNANSILNIGTNQAITVAGGTFQVAAANSTYVGSSPSYNPTQAYSNSGTLQPQTAGNSWTFAATSGTVDLTGAIIDSIGANGLNLSSGVTLSNLNAVQFLNLKSANLPALNLNNALGTFTAANVGFNFGAAVNSYYSIASPAPPAPSSSYSLITTGATSTGSITFTNWFGDFYQDVTTPLNASPTAGYKYIQNGATISLTHANSPVALTAFTVTPYSDAIVLNWTTGAEWAHLGFNVYRSTSIDGGFAQINPTLIRNVVTMGSPHGQYQFYDRAVASGVTYYYKIEDLSTQGTRTLHGPVWAAAQPSLTLAPPPASNAFVGTQPQPSATPSATPSASPSPGAFALGARPLAPGVTLLAETARTMRVQVDVPAFTTRAAEQPPYLRLAQPGYSMTTAAGLPELPQRVIMLAVPATIGASLQVVTRTHATLSGYDIAPAMAWTPVSGTLTPTWVLDSTFYSTNQSLPVAAVSLGAVTESGGQTYLPLIVQPISYNPVARTLDSTSQVVVDISLDGQPYWQPAPGASTPWAQEGALRIFVRSEGLYQIGYNDLVAAGVNGPFQGANTSRLRLLHRGAELALEVASATGSFGPGDSLRFFTPFVSSPETDRDELLLFVDSAPGLRASVANASPIGAMPSRQTYSLRPVQVKRPGFGFFSQAFSASLDHVVWGTFFAPPSLPGDDLLAADVILPNFDRLHDQVTITANLVGSAGAKYSNILHHLRLEVNGTPYPAASAVIAGNSPTSVTLSLPPSAFVAGSNHIVFHVLGDLSNGDYDILTLQDFTITYPHLLWAEQGVADLSYSPTATAIQTRGFTGPDIVAYDVTDPGALVRLDGLATALQPQGDFGATFLSSAAGGAVTRRAWLARASAIPLPDSVELNVGSNLQAMVDAPEVLYIGSAAMLSAAAPLAEFRQSLGWVTASVDIESIYAEFGQGARGAQPIKDFLRYVYQHPGAHHLQYVVLVGGGTYDPKNQLGFGRNDNLLPIKFLVGQDWDYASDNWFVAFNPGDDLPATAIGRISARTPSEVSTYVSKVLAYESGAATPSTSGGMAIFSDLDQVGGEGFDSRADALARQIQGLNSSLPISRLKRSVAGDLAFHQGILNTYAGGPAIIHYLGHGAENVWGASNIFTNSDADSLSNRRLPIVVTMDCMNGRFFEADPTSPAYQYLAGRLQFNPSGGAIAVWGSTSESSPQQQDPFQQALYRKIATIPGIPLGEAVRRAVLEVGETASTAELLTSWTVLGDPMVRANLSFPAPPANTPSGPSSNNSQSSHSGGFLSCGTVSSGTGGSGAGPGAGAASEAGFLLLALFAARRAASLKRRAARA